MRLRALATLLRGYAYRFADEIQLHGVIESVLARSGEHDFVREYAFDRQNRFDFWFPEEGVVIEVKVDGSLPAALRQVGRYTALPGIRGVLLLHTPRWGHPQVSFLHGVPLLAVHLQRQGL